MFGDVEAETAGDMRERWEQVKVEQEARVGIFHDVPGVLPGRALRAKGPAPGGIGRLRVRRATLRRSPISSRRCASWHTDWLCALDTRRSGPPIRELEAELGDVLFAAVNVARRIGADPDLAVRAAARRFRERVERAETLADAQGTPFAGLETEAQERYYQQAKALLRAGDGATGAA